MWMTVLDVCVRASLAKGIGETEEKNIVMGATSRVPKLPKRSVIERLTKKGPECVQEMMAVLTCFKEHDGNEAKCGQQMKTLSECVSRQKEKKGGQKSTVYYHLKRLYYMQRR